MSDPIKSERRISAIAVSRGIGYGKVEFLRNADIAAFEIKLAEHAIPTELERFHHAVASARSGLENLAAAAASSEKDTISNIYDVHRLILDSSFVERVDAAIREDSINAEWAVRQVCDIYRERQRSVTDEHIREKELDIADVADRLIAELTSDRSELNIYPGIVIIARELQPSTITDLAKFHPAGIITERGGWTSHTSILAREFEIPMVSGVKLSPADLADGDLLAVDGNCGEIIINPLDGSLEKLRASILAETNGSVEAGVGEATATSDGTNITLHANVDIHDIHTLATTIGIQGIGLYRSESLIPASNGIPTEAEQFEAYVRLAKAAEPFDVNIRTFDVGPEVLHGRMDSPQLNPSLGLRSIRLGLSQPKYLREQIRSIIMANSAKNVGILLPMISGPAEVKRCREIIDQEFANLRSQDDSVNYPRVGAMIEVPSAVLTVREIARNVDFMCLGTNDLVQYLLAVDRDNELAAEWYQTLHPAVLRALREVAKAGADAGIPVIACGEMAGSTFYVPLLIGLGIRELSMAVKSIRPVRRLIAGISAESAAYLADEASQLGSSGEIEELLRGHYLENWSSLFPSGLLAARHR